MKKTILLAAAIGFLAAGAVQAQDSTTGSYNVAAGGGIVGSKHDLSTTTGIGTRYNATDPLDRICIFCHAPHHTMLQSESGGINYLPLWNHGVTVQSYSVYESDFGDGPVSSGLTGLGDSTSTNQFADRHLLNAEIGQPGAVSKLCLSCHDGTVAVNEYGADPQRSYSQGAGDAMIDASTDQFLIGGGGNLVNHHPIGFDYVAVASMDDEIANPDTVINDATLEITTIRSLLYGGNQMECVTCHDVHNSKNTGETFLWKSNRESGFCLTCHLKEGTQTNGMSSL